MKKKKKSLPLFYDTRKDRYVSEFRCSCGGYIRVNINEKRNRPTACYPHSLSVKKPRYLDLELKL